MVMPTKKELIDDGVSMDVDDFEKKQVEKQSENIMTDTLSSPI